MTQKQCHADCLKCVDENKGCLICIDGYKLRGNKCIKPQKMYLNTLGEDKNKGNIILKTSDNKDYNLAKMNQLTITITLKVIGFARSEVNINGNCHDIVILTKDSVRRICYMQTDDSLNLMEGSTTAFKFEGFSKFFGEFVTISVSMSSKYMFIENSQTYDVDPKLPKNWKSYYAFYLNENPVPAHRDFNYDGSMNTISLYFNRLEIGTKTWAYMSNISVYKGFYTNPFALVTHNKRRSYLVRDYHFTTSVSENKKILKAPTPDSIIKTFCLNDDDVDLSLYNGISQDFAFQNKYYCVADFNVNYEKACSGKTYLDMDSSTRNCLACSLSCPQECAFKGVNGCTANSLDPNVFHKYTNYDTAIINEPTSDINNKYYFSNDIEVRKIKYQDVSRYKKIKIAPLEVGINYAIEFWFYLYNYGVGSVTSGNLGFEKEEIIWDNHNKIVIENVKNEIMVTCYPLFDLIDASNPLYQKANEEFEKYKITKKMADLLYKNSQWAHINCSTDVEKGIAKFGGEEVNFKINIDNSNENPFNYLQQIKDKQLTQSSLTIQNGENAATNYGVLYINQIRLWSRATHVIKPPSCL